MSSPARHRDARRARRRPPRAGDAAAGRLGRPRLRRLRRAPPSAGSSTPPPRPGPPAPREFAERAVAETGFGVVEHKVIKNVACSTGHPATTTPARTTCRPASTGERKIVEIPRPAGVVLALTPSTNPVATVFFKVLLCLMTRNAVVVCPHPYAPRRSARTRPGRCTRRRARRAPRTAACSVVERAVDPAAHRPHVRRAHGRRSSPPAAPPSSAPPTAPGPRPSASGPATCRCSSTGPPTCAPPPGGSRTARAFDNSVLCTNESGPRRRGGGRRRAAARSWPGRAPTCWATTSATGSARRSSRAAASTPRWWARTPPRSRRGPASGCRAAPACSSRRSTCPSRRSRSRTRSSARSSACCRVPTAARGIEAARALLRIGGAGHSAAIHSTDPRTILDFGAAVRVLRVSVNAGASLGGAGLETNLAPSMTIGTGYVGRSSMGENLQPSHLVQPVRARLERRRLGRPARARRVRRRGSRRRAPCRPIRGPRTTPRPTVPDSSTGPRAGTGVSRRRRPRPSCGRRSGGSSSRNSARS